MAVATPTRAVSEILDRALQGQRIGDEDALTLLHSRDLVAVGQATTHEGSLPCVTLVRASRTRAWHRYVAHATTASRTNLSSGTSSSSPASWASSRNVISPARSRGPKR